MEDHKKFFKGALFGALTMLLIIVAGAGIWKVSVSISRMLSYSDKIEADGMEEKLKAIRKIIDENYLYEDEIDEDALTEGMYAGYVNGLGDPYTVYFTSEETKEMFESVSGEFSGVGAQLSQNYETYQVTITKVFESSPAEEAGLKAGDILYKVDERELQDEDLTEIVTWIKGEEGTEVTLGVIRDGKELELTATRRKIEVPTVEYEMKEGQIGYIAISEFDTVTYTQFENALDDLENQGMKGLVIDLRSNPGGSLETVVNMLNLILPKGVVVSTKDREGNTEEYTCDGKHEFSKPMAVLVNQYSASASEIFAGAVQDYGTGEIVGVTTYGKGVVQQIIGLKDGSSIKVTISEYFTPNGRSINGEGVTPDVEVEYERDEENPDADNQLDKALEVIREKL